mmetsp:Transcript_92247/g.246651  ORF Transcript_92247/g.246651 Transcript_92247/m.246651 type:complete len:316 (-) Transcript_92247:41-988(-)
MKSVTKEPSSDVRQVGDTKLTVVDLPGLCDTDVPAEELHKRIMLFYKHARRGVDAFLVVVAVDRFTDDQKQALEALRNKYGKELFARAIIVFTKSEGTIDELVQDVESDLDRSIHGQETERVGEGFLEWFQYFRDCNCKMAVIRSEKSQRQEDADVVLDMVLELGTRQAPYTSEDQRQAGQLLLDRETRVAALQYPDLITEGERVLEELLGGMRLEECDQKLARLDKQVRERQAQEAAQRDAAEARRRAAEEAAARRRVEEQAAQEAAERRRVEEQTAAYNQHMLKLMQDQRDQSARAEERADKRTLALLEALRR